MNRRLILLAALVALPTVAMAQRGGRSRATTHESMFKDDEGPSGPSLRPRDIEDASPLKFLIDKRKDLKLSDAQLDGMKTAEKTLKDKNAPLLKAIDSLVRDMRPPLNRTPESDARMRDARLGLQLTMTTIRENYDSAAKDVIATLDAEQQAKANEMLVKQKVDSENKLREKMGGGRRGGGGEPPPR